MSRNATAEVLQLTEIHPTIATPGGATATVEGDAIALRAADGALVARYDAATGELLLSARTDVTVAAPRGTLSFQAETLRFAATQATVEVERWELRANRVVERAVDVFRTVEGLAETHAKRMRTLVERTLELSGRRTSIVSKEDTRIDGKRVLLG
jgi:hypothetical protein